MTATRCHLGVGRWTGTPLHALSVTHAWPITLR